MAAFAIYSKATQFELINNLHVMDNSIYVGVIYDSGSDDEVIKRAHDYCVTNRVTLGALNEVKPGVRGMMKHVRTLDVESIPAEEALSTKVMLYTGSATTMEFTSAIVAQYCREHPGCNQENMFNRVMGIVEQELML